MSKFSEEEILRRLELLTEVQPSKQSANRAVQRVRRVLTEHKQTPKTKNISIWRIIMKSKITKLATAAVIIIAAYLGINQFFGGTVSFADVIKPILNARTVVFDLIMGEEETGPVIHDIVVGSRIRRTFSNMDTILIIDLDNAKMLSLDPPSKGAAYIDIKGPIREQTKNFLEFVRNIIERLKDLPVEELGQQDIDGRKAIGFLIKEPGLELTIWADPKTALPIRIEGREGQSFTILNIEFDVPVEDRLVSMEIPDGYALHETELQLSEFKEEDFIETLRLWVELLLDGRFPDSISSEELLKQVPRIAEKIGQFDITDEERLQLGMRLGRGVTFFQFLNHKGGWHYAGKDIKFGDEDTPIFWYQPKGSKTYRVIYGDLYVEDVAPENLPE
jgi:hypothetical protein